MALNSYAQLTVNGTALVGQPSVVNVGRFDVRGHIEVNELQFGSTARTDAASRRGAAEARPVRMLKPIDQTTPLLYKALALGEEVQGVIRIFEENRDPRAEPGMLRHRFSLKLARAKVTSIASTSPHPDGPDGERIAYEWVELTAGALTYRDEVHSAEYVFGP